MDPNSTDVKSVPGSGEPAPKRVVLIVDDSAIVLRTASRILKPHFDDVFIADSPDDAAAVLEQHRVTHLFCDNDLGKDLPLGIDLIPQWKEQYPMIERAVLHTASEVPDPANLIGVDAIVAKPASPFEMLRAIVG